MDIPASHPIISFATARTATAAPGGAPSFCFDSAFGIGLDWQIGTRLNAQLKHLHRSHIQTQIALHAPLRHVAATHACCRPKLTDYIGPKLYDGIIRVDTMQYNTGDDKTDLSSEASTL